MLNSEKINILIVDDREANIYALEHMLAKPERNFIHATSGKEALKIALIRDISLIILDVQMPDMDGFEVAQILKSNNKTKDIPIIFASAVEKEQASMLKGFEEGAFDYLHKPLNQEITEAKVAVLLKLHLQKKELKEKNAVLEKYALLISNSADILCIIAPEKLEFVEVNEAVSSLGYTPLEIKGTSLLSYLTEEYRLQVQQYSQETKESFSFETQLYTKDKDLRWFQWNITHRNGLWFANARDITPQKQAEKEIKQLNRDLQLNITQLEVTNSELESFSYSVSHDLRAPLRAINGYATIIQEEFSSQLDEEAQRLLSVIQNNARKMGTLIDDLLAFSKLGRKELVKTSIDTTVMVEQIIKDITSNHQSDLDIQVNHLQSTEGDYRLIYQVFVNLLSNALKYSSRKVHPQIEIGSFANEEEIVYYVKDNGTGFNMDYAHKLFGVFQRLHSDEEFEGTGVGLAIVQRIITKHGGRVWAEGEVNKGATFYFSLPIQNLENDCNED